MNHNLVAGGYRQRPSVFKALLLETSAEAPLFVGLFPNGDLEAPS